MHTEGQFNCFVLYAEATSDTSYSMRTYQACTVKDTSIITSRHRNDCNNWTPDQVIAFIGEDRTGIVVY